MDEGIDIEIFETSSGSCPYLDWEASLDRQARARVRMRINRLRVGNLGDSKSLGQGMHELRVHSGPGYRIYYGRIGKRVVLLLCGGSKKGQNRDIETARSYLQAHRAKIKEERND